ncbi:MAG TPA: nucleotidyltransferase family protein [Rhodanobacteraceae bacterium]
MEYALRHGMLAWLPENVGRDAKREYAASALSGIRTLVRVSTAFTSAGVRAAWFKGPVLSAWLYGEATARRFGDLDVLISRHDRDRAAAVLADLGYTRAIPGRAGDVIFAGLGAWPFDRPGDIRIDLHWRLAADRFPEVVRVDDAVRDAAVARVAGYDVLTLRPAHAAALVLLHAAKHLWYALELPFSIAWLMRRADVDWREVHELSARTGGIRAASAGLRLAATLFDAAIPAPFAPAAMERESAELCRLADVALALPPNTFPDRTLESRLHKLACDSWRRRIAYDMRRLIEPTRAEWDWVQLPDALAPLYAPARVVRLLVAAFSAPRRGSARAVRSPADRSSAGRAV